jgi:molybdopterin converting factor small subunit
MSIQVKLYGDLGDKVRENRDKNLPITLKFEENQINTVIDIFKKLNITEKEVSHIFINGKYSGSGKKVIDGDHIGLFPKNMALIFVEISKNNTIRAEVKLFADLIKYGPSRSMVDLPEGTSIKNIIDKFNLREEKRKLIIILNGKPCHEKDVIIGDGDTIAFFPPLAGG